jgi:adenosylhomocysteine nucleosidase
MSGDPKAAVEQAPAHDRSAPTVVVLAAMPRELRLIARRLRLRPGRVAGLPAWSRGGVVAAAIGVGPARAAAGCAGVLREVPASRVLVTGVAGAVDPALCVGTLILPEAVVDVRTGRRFAPSTGAPRAGVLASVDAVFAPPVGARCGPSGALGLPAGTTAVDMETAAVAAVAEERGIAWDVVRAISDTSGMLTLDVAGVLRPDGRADLVTAARLVLRKPGAAVRLVRLGIGAARAGRAASAAVCAQLDSLGLPDSRNR